ncbi:MAG TPA: ABC transporter permease [Terriglobales bacterium]|nr:ABC transporter permease [Terriglobales bacterium]
MGGLVQDLRYAWRQLCQSPGFTAVAVLTLALGIGMNTAVFSVVNAVVLRLPFQQPERLVVVENSYSETDHTPTSFPDFLDWRARDHSFTGLAATFRSRFNLTGLEEPQRIRGRYISQDYFALFGLQPALGRSFLPAEHVKGGASVCLISQDFWRRELGSDSGVVGRTLTLDGVPYGVVGVMPANVPDLGSVTPTDLWIPLESKPPYDLHGTNYLQVIGRLKSGVTRESAQSDLRGIQEQINQQFPANKHDVLVMPLTHVLLGDVRPLLEILLAAVGLVLLIACANVANLLLARGVGRVRELALREALGAERGRIIRQLLTESVLLSGIALLASTVVVLGGTRILLNVWPESQQLPQVAIDWRVAAFAAFISAFAVVVFGVAPALFGSRINLQNVMKEGGRGSSDTVGHSRLRTAFVASEMALALVLVIASMLTLRSFYRLLHTNPGFNSQGLLTANVALPDTRYSPAAGRQFFTELLSRINRLPGVRSAAATAFVPLGEGGQTGDFQVEGLPTRSGEERFAEHHFVTPGYFETLQIPLLRGRFFNETDKEGAPKVVVVNHYMARQLWPGQDPVGKRIEVLGEPNDWSVVIGVVADTKTDGLNMAPSMQIYMPTLQRPITDMFLVVRSSTDAASLIPLIKRAVFELDNQQPVANIALMDQLLSRSWSSSRSAALLLGVFSAIAMLMAAMGLYAVMAYSVSQRVQEIGIRVALGAQAADIQRMVMKMCTRICVWGLGGGLLGALLTTRLLHNFLFGVGPTDLATFVLSILLLAFAAVLASYLPARRAARVDPMVALRYQ